MKPLPIDALLPDINACLRAGRSAVVVATPGAGKTTRIAPAILSAQILPPDKSIVLLQPRRVAARAAASRIAEEQGWKLGAQIGYQIRFENRTSASTRIRVVTEGILSRRIQSDPFLEDVGCVILDEFHERSIHTDLALALLREVRATVRPDLRIVVMSATMDPVPVTAYLGDADIYRADDQKHPVTIVHQQRIDALPVWEKAAAAIRQVFMSPGNPVDTRAGHVLVFLPGMAEIRKTESLISAMDADVHVLHSSVSSDDQDRALRPSVRRKLILSTNIAETSITIDGVTAVIDSGLARTSRYDPRLGLERLELSRISKSSATQRTGRAGRTGPGTCIRLWTHEEHSALEEENIPEIQRIDLSPVLLCLYAYGIRDAREFEWFESPRAEAIDGAHRLLFLLGAIDAENRITTFGKQIALLPVHPRLAALVLAGLDSGVGKRAATLAAVLSESDIVSGKQRTGRLANYSGDSDVIDYLEWFDNANASEIPYAMRSRVEKLSRQLLQACTAGSHALPSQTPERSALRKCLLRAYPDRVTLRRKSDTARGVMVGGRGVVLEESSSVRSASLFLSIDPWEQTSGKSARGVQAVTESRASIASAVELEWLEELFPYLMHRISEQTYDTVRNKLIESRRVLFAGLVIAEELHGVASVGNHGNALFEYVRGAVGCEAFLRNHDEAWNVVGRYRLISRLLPELELPPLVTEAMEQAVFMSTVGKTSLERVSAKELAAALIAPLTYPQRNALDDHAPPTLLVPSGHRHALDYKVCVNSNTAPVAAVRLQELFGMTESPSIARGRMRIVLNLLGPNYRPVQVTSDLSSFWNTTYQEVRKELRARYPRHPWPEDPWNAPAIAVGRRRR